MTFEDIKDQSQIVQKHLDTIIELVGLTRLARTPAHFQAIHYLLEQESEVMSRESDKLSDMMKQFKEEKRDMRKIIVQGVLALALLFICIGVVSAQSEATPPVAEATVSVNGGEPIVVPVVEQPPDNTIYVLGFLVMTAFVALREFMSNRQMGTLVTTVNKALDNKQLLDEGHRQYMQSSLQVQEFVKLLTGVAGFIGSVVPGDDLAEKLHDFGSKVTQEGRAEERHGVG